MVGVDLQVTFGSYLEIEEAVTGDLRQHVIQERNARFDLMCTAPVQVQSDADLGFLGAAVDRGRACHDILRIESILNFKC